ncbi:MAG: hypothetical protein ACT4O9_02035 [Blastocatellia bacterium]
MKYILTMIAFLFVSTAPLTDSAEASNKLRKPVACRFFTNDNAMKILGREVRGTDGEMTEDGNGRTWSCTFSPASGEKGPKIYFIILRGTSEEAARKVFQDIRQSNKDHAGFEEWPGVADEAIVHSDDPNFHLVMARKGAKTIRVKVNPATGISLNDVKSVAEEMARKL